MSEASYRKQLAADLPRWRGKGWVTPEGAAAILASLDSRKGSALAVSSVAGFFGAILIGVGVLGMVAANWEGLSRHTRLAALLGAMALAYGLAGWLRARAFVFFSEAAILAGALVFAGAIVLIGQSYHLSGGFAGAVLLWTLGCLAAALLAQSVSASALAVVGGGYWGWLMAIDNKSADLWTGLGLIVAAGVVATLLKSRPARTFAVLGLYYWATFEVFTLGDRWHWPMAGGMVVGVATALILWALGTALTTVKNDRLSGLGADLLAPSLAVFLFTLAMLQGRPTTHLVAPGQQWIVIVIAELGGATALAAVALLRRGLTTFDLAAVPALGLGALGLALWDPPDSFTALLVAGGLTLLGVLWVIWLSQSSRHRAGMLSGLIAFGLEVLYLYTVTVGPILDRALAFLVGGVLLVGMAAVLVRIDRRLAKREEKAA